VEGKQKKQKVVEAKKQVDQEIIQQDTNHKQKMEEDKIALQLKIDRQKAINED